MAQKTEPDLRELKDLITGLREELRTGFADADKKIEKLDKKMDLGFSSLDKKMDLGFSEVKGELKVVDSRLTTIESTLTKLDTRLWTFIGIVLSVTLGTLLTIFVRFMFSDSIKF